ncbi:MAG: NusG domain II-containing protein [Candidatus Sulfobium sp.]
MLSPTRACLQTHLQPPSSSLGRKPQARGIVIDVNGKPAYNFPIDVNRTVTFYGPYGKMVVEIKDRKVRMKEAHCPNLLCVRQGWISKGVIVCLPNRVVVTVSGGTAGPKGVDAVTG